MIYSILLLMLTLSYSIDCIAQTHTASVPSVNTLNIQANKFYNEGYFLKALPLYEQILVMVESKVGKQHLDYAIAIKNIGMVYRKMGEFQKALLIYKQDITIREQTGDIRRPDYIASVDDLAGLYTEMGQYEKAKPLYESILAITEKTVGKKDPTYARYLNNLAVLYVHLGQYEKAKPLYESILAITEKTVGRKNIGYATSLRNLAVLYSELGRNEMSMQLYSLAKAIRRKTLGKNHLNYAESLADLAGEYYISRNYKKALQLSKEALAIRSKRLGKQNPVYAKNLSEIALYYRFIGNFEKAIHLYEQVLNIQGQRLGKQHPDYAQSLYALAILYDNLGMYRQEASLLRQSQKIYKQQLLVNLPLLTQEDIKAYQKNKKKNYDVTLSLAYKSGLAASQSQPYDDILIQKGLQLLSIQILQKLTLQSSDSTVQALFKYYRALHYSLDKAYTNGQIELVHSLRTKVDSINQEILIRLPQYKQAFENLSITWQQIEKALKPGEAALEYVQFRYFDNGWHDSIFYAAMLVRPNMPPHFVQLGEQRLIKRLITRNLPLQDHINSLYQGAKGDSLYSLLWKPLEYLLKDIKKVYYSSDGLIHQMALGALPTPKGLLLSQEIELIPLSSTRLLAQTSPSPDLAYNVQVSAAVFGNTSYEPDQPDSTWLATRQISFNAYNHWQELAAQPDTVTWISLDKSQAQTDSIRQTLKAINQLQVFTGSSASEENLKALSGHSPTVLHLATHGFYTPQDTRTLDSLQSKQLAYKLGISPEPMQRSGVVLAGANYAWLGGELPDSTDDGILTAYEVAGLDLSNTQLVVLSACQSALGDIQGSEGVFGLQRGFKQAGVRYQLVSLWSVEEEKTNEFMSYFYQNWVKGQTIRAAFQATQNYMQQRYPKEPYYWAAFTLLE